MLKKIFFLSILIVSNVAFSNENLLTIQQQVDRLQREVSDLSQLVYSNNQVNDSQESNGLVSNLSAIDMRIYDIEKDVNKLTGDLEEIYFLLDEFNSTLESLEIVIDQVEKNLVNYKNSLSNSNVKDKDSGNDNKLNNENSLGSLKIDTKKNNSNTTNEILSTNEEDKEDLKNYNDNLSPEDQFQAAFDNIRSKNWDKARELFTNFINNNASNQLSGSAHYWLGELYILENKFRDAALVFAEGYQNYPNSIKAPDMLYKLAISLYEVQKINESCKTLEKLIGDFPKSKFIKNAKKDLNNFGCLLESE